MKNTMKIFLVIALFSSMAFAGDMPTGGFAGEMGAGGKTCPPGTTCLVNLDSSKNDAAITDDKTVSTDPTDSILEAILAYLDTIL